MAIQHNVDSHNADWKAFMPHATTRILAVATSGLLAALLLTGCAPAADVSSESQRPTPSSPADSDHETPSGGPRLTPNGNLAKDIGEEGFATYGDVQYLTFAVTEIQLDPICNPAEGFGMGPQVGRFVALRFEISTTPDYIAQSLQTEPLKMFWNDFVAYSKDGSLLETGNAGTTCFEEPEAIPFEIPAGATSTGWLVMDVPADAASVAWQPSYVLRGDDAGWEWGVPTA